MDSKPTTITAAEFMASDYGAKWCRITDKFGDIVIDVRPLKEPYCDFDLQIVHAGGAYHDYSDTKLTVTWLSQPAAIAPANAPSGDVPGPFPYDTPEQLSLDLADMRQSYDALKRELNHEKEDSALFLQSLANRDQDVARLEFELAAKDSEIARLRGELEAANRRDGMLSRDLVMARSALMPFYNMWVRWFDDNDSLAGISFGSWFWREAESSDIERDYKGAVDAINKAEML